MGYTTTFAGSLTIDRKLDTAIIAEIEQIRITSRRGEKQANQPQGSYCGWMIEGDQKHLIWDGGEKFYEAIEWLEYLIKYILKGHIVNGELMAIGEEYENDTYRIQVTKNTVKKIPLSPKEAKLYSRQRAHEAQKKFGKILAKTKVSSRPLHPWIQSSLTELLLGRFIKRAPEEREIALVQEQDGGLNTYNFIMSEPEENRIPQLIPDRPSPLSEMSEIIQYSSPLFRQLLRSKHAYCICRSGLNWSSKTLYIIENDQYILTLRDAIREKTKKDVLRQSSDLYLVWYFFKKLMIAFVLATLTYKAAFFFLAGLFAAVTTDRMDARIFSIVLIGCIGAIYYALGVKLLFPLLRIVFPIELFRARTVSNKIKS